MSRYEDYRFYLVKKFYKGYHGEEDLLDEDSTISFFGTDAQVAAFVLSKNVDEERDRNKRLASAIEAQRAVIATYQQRLALQASLSEDERRLLGIYPKQTENLIAACEREIATLEKDMKSGVIQPNDAFWVDSEDNVTRNWAIDPYGQIDITPI